MLDEFRLWFRANEKKLKGSPLFAKIRRSETEDETLTPPLYKGSVDLKTEDLLANFTVWGTGGLQVIIMSEKTGEELVVDDRQLLTPSEMRPLLDRYCEQIVNREDFTKR